MPLEYTTITVDMARVDSTAPNGTLYAELTHVVTLANGDVVYPEKRAFTVTSGAATIQLACTSTAIKNQNAAYVVSFAPTGQPEKVLGRIRPTASASPLDLADLLEVGATSVSLAHTLVAASNITFVASVAALQALTGMNNLDRAFVPGLGIYRYSLSSADTACGVLVLVAAGGTGRWILEVDGADARPVFNVQQYGALGDNVADDIAAITKAITAAEPLKGIVLFPDGTYKISSPIPLASGVNLVGASMIGTVITTDDTTIALLSGSGDVRLSIENLKLNGPGAGTNIGLSLTAGCADIAIRNVFFDSLNKAVYTNDTYSVSFDTCRILGCAFGYDLTAASNAITLTNCAMLGGVGATGLVFTNSSSLNVIGSAFEGCAPVSIINSDGVNILGNYFENAPPIGGPGTSIAAYVNLGAAGSGTSSPALGVNIAGNLFNVGADVAISVRSVDGITVAGNTFNTDDYAFEWYQYDTAPKSHIHIGSNRYNIGLAGYDQSKLILYSGATTDSTNSGQDDFHMLPMFMPTQLEPQTSTIPNGHGSLWFDGTTFKIKSKSSGGTLSSGIVPTMLKGSTTWDPGSVASGGTTTTTLTVTGAVLGDFILCSFNQSLAGLVLTGYVSAPDTVTAVLTNPTGGAVDLASGTLRAAVIAQ